MTAFNIFMTALSNTTNYDGVLGEMYLEYPPNEKVDYWATPLNSVVFGWMGVDGVHYAILKIDNQICDESPVIQIGPMDFDEPYALLGPTFSDYLAIGCASSREEIEDILVAENKGKPLLLNYLRSHFDQSRFWSEDVNLEIGPYMKLIVPKPDEDQSTNDKK